MTRRDRDLHQRFDDLAQESSPQRRGRALETLVAELFEQAGYKVKLDPRSAEPRQTDLVAVKGQDLYLVEVKWTTDPAGIDVVDALWARLRRTDRAARGVLVSVEGVTSGALDLIAHGRDRPIVVITGEELGALLYAPGRLPHALRRKHRELFFNATVLLGERALLWPEPLPGELAQSEFTIVKADGSRSAMIQCKGGFGSCLFATMLVDLDWIPTAGAALAADVSLQLRSSGRLADLLKGLGALGWTSSPHWVIQQADNCWFGFGAREFVEAIDDYAARYDGLEHVHHTEQALYYDTFDGGFYTVALNISVSESRVIQYCNLSLQMEGMPFDNEPLNHLLEFCEVERNVYGRSMTTAAVQRAFIPPADQVEVEPLAFVVRPEGPLGDLERSGGEWAYGVVVENPYWRGAASPGEKHKWWPDGADEPRYLVCSLRHHHQLSTPKHPYRLTGCESARTADTCIVRPVVDW